MLFLTILKNTDEGDDDQQVDVFHHYAFHDDWWWLKRAAQVKSSISLERSIPCSLLFVASSYANSAVD